MAVSLSITASPDGATYGSAVYDIGGKKYLKNGYYMVILSERHQIRFVKTVTRKDGVGWATDLLCIH